MKVKIKATLAVIAFGLSVVNAQTNSVEPTTEPTPQRRTCGTEVPSTAWDEWFNSRVEKYKLESATAKRPPTSITIPVVVHVIHGGQIEGAFPNISKYQIASQINILNQDFAGKGFNSHQLASTGFSLVGAANTNITFCLAQYDPSGNLLPEPGINRINYNTFGWTNPSVPNTLNAFKTLMDGTIKPLTIWDPTYYFNIWVSDVHPACQILGYATFPQGSSSPGLPAGGDYMTDGIWVWGKSFGNTGALDPIYNKGRTAVHETGHWLGLRHIGGDASNPNGDCNATDFCDDTPPQKGGFGGGTNGQNFGAPTYPINVGICGSPYGDMFMNFMDYTNDAVLYMFTPDQKTRMHTALAEGIYRNQLAASAFSLCSGMAIADFLMDSIACTNSELSPFNNTSGTSNITYSWTVEPNVDVSISPNTTTANPIFVFGSPGYYTITMVSTNTIGISSMSMALNVDECLGISANALERSVKLSPNPSTGWVQLELKKVVAQKTALRVHNAVGVLVYQEDIENVTGTHAFDLSAYPSGIYFVMLESGGEKTVKKLIITR